MNAVERFKTLPEAHAIPDEIWTLVKLEDHLEKLTRQIKLCRMAVSTASHDARIVLAQDWSDVELQKAGWL